MASHPQAASPGDVEDLTVSAASDIPASPAHLSIRRVGEPVLFALAAIGVYWVLPLAIWALPFVADGSTDSNVLFLVLSVLSIIGAGLLFFAAGWRRSLIDILALFVGAGLVLAMTYGPILANRPS
jgi:hypothetical protein